MGLWLSKIDKYRYFKALSENSGTWYIQTLLLHFLHAPSLF